MDCLFVCLSDVWGGIEKNVVVRAVELQNRGHQVAVVCLERTFEDRYREKGVPVFTVPNGGRFRLNTRRAMARLIKMHRPQAVFSAVKADWWLVAAPAHRYGVQSIVLYLGIHRRLKENIKYWFLFRVFKARLVVNSQSLQHSVIQYNRFLTEANVSLIHNGFRVQPAAQSSHAVDFPDLPEDAFIVGCAGRLAPTKQYLQLADILPKLPANVVVLLVGDGPESAAIQQRLAEAGVLDRVFLLGQLPYEGMPAFFQRLDVFLHLSRLEGMANVLNEALSFGVPVVSTRVSGTDEVTDHGRFGIITDINDIEALANGVLAVMNGAFQVEPDQARQWIEQQFGMEQMLQKTEAVLFGRASTLSS